MNRYQELKEKRQKEVNAFPMVFAFSNEQFVKAMEQLGLTEHDTDKVYSLGGGGFIRKTDSKAHSELFSRLGREHEDAIKADLTGEGYIKDMFAYELANHEYGYTYELDDTLDALGLTIEEVKTSSALSNGLTLAKKVYLQEVM